MAGHSVGRSLLQAPLESPVKPPVVVNKHSGEALHPAVGRHSPR